MACFRIIFLNYILFVYIYFKYNAMKYNDISQAGLVNKCNTLKKSNLIFSLKIENIFNAIAHNTSNFLERILKTSFTFLFANFLPSVHFDARDMDTSYFSTIRVMLKTPLHYSVIEHASEYYECSVIFHMSF